MTKDYQLREHPTNTIRRLKALGDWPEAVRLMRRVKGKYRRRFAKAGGPAMEIQRLEVAKAGWDAVHDRWPPPSDATPLESLAAYLRTTRATRHNGKSGELPRLSLDAERRFDEIGETDNMVDEILWVYHRIDDAYADPLQCPSRGAWSLLGQARRDRQRFYEKTYLPAVRDNSRRQAIKADEYTYTPSRAERLACEELRQMIEEAVEESQKVQCPKCGESFTPVV